MNTQSLTLTVFFTTLFTVNSSFAGSIITDKTIECWEASLWDKDGDGFASSEHRDDGGAWKEDRETFTVLSADATFTAAHDAFLATLRLVRNAKQMTCPVGWVKSRGDCNDNPTGGAEIHPRQAERYGNGIDDNCNGEVDEPNLFYHPGGNNNQTDRFDIGFSINDPQIQQAQESQWVSLKAQVEYQKLSNTDPDDSEFSELKSLKTYFAYGNFSYAEVELDGLDPTTVYRARVQFYKLPSWKIARRFGRHGVEDSQYEAIGDPSGWYYTTTDGTGEVSKARTDVLLQGFFQYYESNHRGLVGYKGAEDADGTRYGGDMGEAWCSEFYSWVTNHAFDGMNHRYSVTRMMDYFDGKNAGVLNPSEYQVKNKIRRGDYLGEDTGGDENKNHSAMFLAYDRYWDVIWTLDGNSHGYQFDPSREGANRAAGNEVTIRVRSLHHQIEDEDGEIREVPLVRYWGKLGKSPLK